MAKPLSEQLADLSVQAKKAEDDFAATKKESHDKMVARREQLRTAATQSVDKLKQEMKSAGAEVSSSFSALKAKVAADAETLKANVKQWKKGLDAERAENHAEEMEWEASVAIDYAISAVEQAKLAAVDAVIARREAIEAKKA